MKTLIHVATMVMLCGSAYAAEVGAPAPDFSLKDTDGKPVKLGDFKGKVVVLEWFNPECPFVKAAHGKGSLVGDAKKQTAKGVVWLAVNEEEDPADAFVQVIAKDARYARATFVYDRAGEAGQAWKVEALPTTYVIDPQGKVEGGTEGYTSSTRFELSRLIGRYASGKERR